nr:MAG TPA: hypothetical protein [Caudoviricetes sp.]
MVTAAPPPSFPLTRTLIKHNFIRELNNALQSLAAC